MIGKILEDREKRYEKVLLTLERGAQGVICGKINCPGQNKNTEESLIAFTHLLEILKNKILKDKEFLILEGYDGKSIIAGINTDCMEIKKKTVDIEECHPLGRIFDIDIYNSDGIPMGRKEIGMQDRKCLVCGGNAKVCVREKAHSLEETLLIFNKIINDFEGKNEK